MSLTDFVSEKDKQHRLAWDKITVVDDTDDAVPFERAGEVEPPEEYTEHSIHCVQKDFDSTRLNTPITRDDSIAQKLPSELLDIEDNPVTWKVAKQRYDRHLAGEYNNKSFGNTHQNRAKTKYWKMLNNDRLKRLFYRDCHIFMITLRGSPSDDNGNPIPPLDFVEQLNVGASRAIDNLDTPLGDRRSAWCAVLAGTEKFATGHWHILGCVQDSIEPEDFAGVVKSHARNSPVASIDNHSVEDTVIVARAKDMELIPIGKMDRERGNVSRPARYVATQLPHIAGASGKSFELEHGAIMWGYSGNSFRKSGGFLDR